MKKVSKSETITVRITEQQKKFLESKGTYSKVIQQLIKEAMDKK
ncbi:hypothetical protein OGY35_23965 [Citrobacter sp. Ct235]|nr:hypothetical protein [Citrobacter sp. Ct235]MDM2738412.1 hypothetical protein [Citrobacter sp. Ct235]